LRASKARAKVRAKARRYVELKRLQEVYAWNLGERVGVYFR